MLKADEAGHYDSMNVADIDKDCTQSGSFTSGDMYNVNTELASPIYPATSEPLVHCFCGKVPGKPTELLTRLCYNITGTKKTKNDRETPDTEMNTGGCNDGFAQSQGRLRIKL